MKLKTVEIRTRKTIEKFGIGSPTPSEVTIPRFEDAAKGGERWCYAPNGKPRATEHPGMYLEQIKNEITINPNHYNTESQLPPPEHPEC